ncbi:methionine adenosyltransferase [bacterium CG17_big_fil_post_rev_8_21_14_2_50_64_8]|nr:MAG: methionine adenosyltransferase [bacterium CG17_big_fil_post_rev_8_21_14_2_50_64_8]PJA76177.1 MAG: methionine adenosyltransferase [bacterium CG_4_9_14_3_um_filter_65_15]
MSKTYLFTSESVTEGHPDKVADQISDAVVDAILAEDAQGRVACETLVTTGLVFLAGEITTDIYVDLPKIVRGTVREIGYVSSTMGFDADSCAVNVSLDKQSEDIAQGVDSGGAGDQGLMFGYACGETDVLMPLPITLAHRMARQLAAVRKDGTLPWALPDGKTQVSVRYEDDKPVAVDTVVISTMHRDSVSNDDIRAGIRAHVIEPVLDRFAVAHDGLKVHINPTGRFVTGGPQGDCGLTGRKIIVDTYGGSACHGGGAFSGKDSTKVDRSAAYAARHLAKNIVAAELAGRCQVQLAYAIGVPEPVSIAVDTYGTGRVPDERITAAITQVVDLTPGGIIARLDLRKPIFRQTAAYGHFGRDDVEFTWEKLDLRDALQNAAG